mgnify:CR=1
MNKTYISLSSLAMDLKRAALGYYSGSFNVAEKFLNEANKREKEINKNSVKPNIRRILIKLEKLTRHKDKKSVAEDFLMYSILLQNASLKLNDQYLKKRT